MAFQDLNRDAMRCLLNNLAYDAERRYEILREELTHLINAIRYRIDPDIELFRENGAKEAPKKYNPGSSHKAFLARLGEAAKTLLDECVGDIQEMTTAYRDSYEKWQATEGSKPREEVRFFQNARFEVLWNAKCVSKAMVIAERMGDLHDRLEQFLQRTNPDHPDPTLRRRLEQGLTDKYLSELTRWTHRDLAEFIAGEDYLHAPYVHREVPSTFQFWAYSDTAHHHSFMTFDEHVGWAGALEAGASKDRKFENEQPRDRFVSVALSYWIPERPALVPILGHELAHQVLRVAYGRQADKSLLETDGSALASLYRRVHSCAEQWLVPRIAANQASAGMVDNLVTEIVCDSLAAVRFGWAYAFAWTLETLADERFAQLFHDRYGMLRRFSTGPNASGGDESLKAMRHDAVEMAKGLRSSILAPLYRGQVLFEVLRTLDLEHDEFATQLRDAFQSLLDVLLFIYTDGDDAREEFERALARDLARSVCWEVKFAPTRFIAAGRHFWSKQSNLESHIEDARSGIVRPERQEQPGHVAVPLQRFRNPSLKRQRLSQSYREAVVREISAIEEAKPPSGTMSENPKAKDLADARTLTDLVWRAEWLLAAKKEAGAVDNLRNQARELLQLGMDDYLFRTGNPLRLFATLTTGADKQRILGIPGLTNKLFSVDSAYNADPIRRLEDDLRDQEPFPLKVSLGDGQDVEIKENMKEWLPTPIRRGAHYLDLFDARDAVEDNTLPNMRKAIIYLDLMRIRPRESLVDAELRIQAPSKSSAPAKYRVMSFGTLLGRYDAFAFYEQLHKDGALRWDFSRETGNPDGTTSRVSLKEWEVAYVTRAKRLVRVWSEKAMLDVSTSPGKQSAVIALVLISLTWESSRGVVAQWLTSNEAPKCSNLELAVFLSDGWEDLVLVLAPKPGEQSGCAVVEECVELVSNLNKNPFIASTETLFTQEVVNSPPDNFHFRFTCRVGADEDGYSRAHHGFRDAFKAIEEDLNLAKAEALISTDPTHTSIVAGMDKAGAASYVTDTAKRVVEAVASLRELDVAGNKDFEVQVPVALTPFIDIVHRHLHDKLPRCRIETRVSWPSSVGAPKQPTPQAPVSVAATTPSLVVPPERHH